MLASNFVALTMINIYGIYTLECKCTDRLDILCFISDYILFRACTQTAQQSYSQMPFVWKYYVIIIISL